MIRVGPAGWSYADWEGPIHPRPKPRGYRGLAALAEVFRAVEVNVTFYRDPTPELAAGWLDQVAPHDAFRFAVKVPGVLTHAREPATPRALGEAAAGFLAALGPLAADAKLGALLAQFPVSFRPGPREERYLDALVDAFAGRPLVLELRHAAWFEDARLAHLAERGASVAWIDLPDARDHPSPERKAGALAVSPLAYLRLHGRNAAAWFDGAAGRDARYDWLYSREELAPIVEVARRASAGHDETLVVTNNHFSGKAIANGVALIAALEARAPEVPARWIESFPWLAAHARPRGQSSLFGGAG